MKDRGVVGGRRGDRGGVVGGRRGGRGEKGWGRRGGRGGVRRWGKG